jgi:hypothetical protein
MAKAKTTKKKIKIPEIEEKDIKKTTLKSVGRPSLKLDSEQIKQVEIMAGLGLKMDDISLVMGFSRRSLYHLCDRDERIMEAIKRGKAKAYSKVAKTAYELATSGKHLAMTMFWLKCQQRWREVHPDDNSNSNEVTFRTKIGEKGQIMSETTTDNKTEKDEL